ncbi:MAG: efflux RND transporter permease subunit [Dermatophilaceae bacterium]
MTRLTRLSLANRTVVLLVAVVVLVVGLVATRGLKQELIPSLDAPSASVVSVYAGAAPEVVEQEVSRPIEDAVKAVDGVTRVTSTSSSGLSQVRVEWDFGIDTDKLVADIRSAVDGTKTELPSDVTPSVFAGSFDDVPVVLLAVSSSESPEALSNKLKTAVVPKLKAVTGVRDVSIGGQQQQQVVITVRPADQDRLGVDITTLPQVFAASGIAVPAGSLSSGGSTLDVEVGRTLSSVAQVAAIQVQGTDGPVALSDIADVREQPVDTTSISRVNGKPSYTLAVTKTPAGNTVTVSQGVRAAVPQLQAALGNDATFTTVFDQAPYIEDSIHDLSVEGVLGLVFAVLVILVFLMSVRLTLITAVSIPLSLVIALIGLRLGGYTLNILTLGALTVAIGRVVDDSIVVIENIKRHQGMGEFGPESILRAVREVAGAVTSSTLTTVAVFLPIGLVSGQAGELFRPFAVTVTIALLGSLLVALTVVPVFAWWFMRGSASEPAEGDPQLDGAGLSQVGMPTSAERHAREQHVGQQAEELSLASAHESPQTRLQRAYLPVLRFSLAHRALTVALALLVFVGTLALAPRLKTDFLGEAGATTLRVVQELPAGTSLAQTDAAAARVEKVVAAEPTVESFQTTVGGNPSQLFFGAVAGPNQASVSVTLKSGSSGGEVAERLRQQIRDMSDVGTVEVVSGNNQSSNVAVVVEGADPQALRTASDQVVGVLHGIPQLADVRTDLTEAKQMLKVDLDANAVAKAGMAQAQVGTAVTQAVTGTRVGRVTIEDTSLDVILRSREPVTTVQQLSDLPLPVTAKQTADARKAASEAATDRQQALADRTAADQQASLNEQIATLRSNRDKASQQVATITAQLDELRSSLAAVAALPPGITPPPTSPTAALQAQIEALEKSEAAAQAQVSAADESIAKALTSQSKARTQRAESQAVSQAARDAQTAKATPVRLGEVATVQMAQSPASVARVDGARAATVTATPSGSDLGATTAAVRAGLAKLALPDGVTVRLAGVSERQQESFQQLGLAMLVAIAIVYLIMVATFRSLLQPLILLVSIPFAATGALGLLLLTDTPLGVPAMIGLLMLIGIVVTNAIVLIDLINQFRARRESVREAILDGARLRLRPIIMTALATICALLPMALGVTGGGIFISKPLAIVVIGGLVSSTVLTLLIVPVLFDIVERMRARRRRVPEPQPQPQPVPVA